MLADWSLRRIGDIYRATCFLICACYAILVVRNHTTKLLFMEDVNVSLVSSWHIGVAAEAFVAAQFARYGIDVSVQYGANQPEYDLIASKRDTDQMLKVSVKGSQDGSWGLTQKYKKNCDYHEAIDRWLNDHGNKTIFCLVQFKDVSENEMPRMYLATPAEIAEYMKNSRGGNGGTILHEDHVWGDRAIAAGSHDTIPPEWKFTRERAIELLNMLS